MQRVGTRLAQLIVKPNSRSQIFSIASGFSAWIDRNLRTICSVKASYFGSPVDDVEILTRLPEEISNTLRNENGFIAAGGGLHVRGACVSPAWHSIRAAWEGEFALHRLFPMVHESDIPLAEDCFGDQYLLRDRQVVRLQGETGEIEATQKTWNEFLATTEADSIEFLGLSYLIRFQEEGGVLMPGYLLSVYPPFVAKECVNPSVRPIPSLELRLWLADFARQIRGVEDGQRIQIRITQ
jgi:hypothetical protein